MGTKPASPSAAVFQMHTDTSQHRKQTTLKQREKLNPLFLLFTCVFFCVSGGFNFPGLPGVGWRFRWDRKSPSVKRLISYPGDGGCCSGHDGPPAGCRRLKGIGVCWSLVVRRWEMWASCSAGNAWNSSIRPSMCLWSMFRLKGSATIAFKVTFTLK